MYSVKSPLWLDNMVVDNYRGPVDIIPMRDIPRKSLWNVVLCKEIVMDDSEWKYRY